MKVQEVVFLETDRNCYSIDFMNKRIRDEFSTKKLIFNNNNTLFVEFLTLNYSITEDSNGYKLVFEQNFKFQFNIYQGFMLILFVMVSFIGDQLFSAIFFILLVLPFILFFRNSLDSVFLKCIKNVVQNFPKNPNYFKEGSLGLDNLIKLDSLLKSGLLSKDEFEQAKSKILKLG